MSKWEKYFWAVLGICVVGGFLVASAVGDLNEERLWQATCASVLKGATPAESLHVLRAAPRCNR